MKDYFRGMKLNKLLTTLLLCLLMTSVQAWSAEPQYTRAQVDSIVAAKVARQLKDQQIELQIERVSNEKYARSLDEQNNRLVEHDHKMSSRYTWIGILITLISALFGIGGPLLLRKDSKEILEAIADNNTKTLDSRIKEHDGKINVILASIGEVEKKVNEMAAGAEKASKEAEESAKQAKASEYFSQALAEKDLDKKIDLYTKAISLNHTFWEAFYHRSFLFKEKGDNSSARMDLVMAINLLYDKSFFYKVEGGEDGMKQSFAHAKLGLELAKQGNLSGLVKKFEELIGELGGGA